MTRKIKAAAFLTLALCLYITNTSAQVCFGTATNYSTAVTITTTTNVPYALCSADFNGDGFKDIITANGTTSNISILLGNGSGSFGAPANFSAGTAPRAVVSADFNGDGKADVAVANSTSNNVSVLLGNGSGGFGAATNFTVGTTPYSIISADFNADSKADLVTANYGSNNISILIGNGSGSFSAATNFTVSPGPYSVINADFNGDAKVDLATANYTDTTVSVLIGDGLGNFGSATDFTVGIRPIWINTSDFNGDSKADLVTANNTSNNVSVLIGNGSGSFGAATNFIVGTSPRSITCGDFNADSKIDLAVANSGSAILSVLNGDGSGNFGAATNYAVGSGPYGVINKDFNGDGKPDLASANITSKNVSIVLASGSGSFGTVTNFSVGTTTTSASANLSGPLAVCSGDFNNDAFADMAVVNYTTSKATVFLGNGTGFFGTGSNFTTGGGPQAIISTDFNNDGIADLATGNRSGATNRTVSVLLGTGGGNFGTANTITMANVSGCGGTETPLCSADFNNDGKADIAATGFGCSAALNILLGDGLGGFSLTSTSLPQGPYGICTGDFNNDGKADLATANPAATSIFVLMGDGVGGFSGPTSFSTVGTYPWSIICTDFNGDGKKDLATANETSNNVSVFLGDGLGGFGTATVFGVGTNPYALTAGDYNFDGNTDLVTSNYGSNNVSVLLGNGAGSFASFSNFNVGTGPRWICTGDFDSDGRGDLATSNYTANNASVLLNTLPNLSISGTTPICSGNSSLLSCSGATTYAWSANAGSATTNTVIVSPGSTATYTVNGTTAGCTNSKTITITVNLSPTVTAVASDSTICYGSTVTMIGGGATSTYTWTGGVVNGVAFSPSATQTYTVYGSDSNGCKDSADMTIVVNPLPNVGGNVLINTACYSNTVTLTGTGALTYTWSGGITNGVPFALSSSTSYTVTGTNANGCVKSDSVYVGLPFLAPTEICQVSVDSLSINNVITWEKSQYPLADSFFVYRDTANNNYGIIGKVPATAFSEFVDSVRTLYAANGDPNASSWRYKIAIKDTCGVLGPMSPYHQTLFMIFPSGNFSWNHYQIEGQPTPVPQLSSYLFKRDDFATGNYVTIQALSASSTAYVDPNYATYQLTADWRVETFWSQSCVPTMRYGNNAAEGTIVKSRSNVKNNRTTGQSAVGSMPFSVFPNPASTEVTIVLPKTCENCQVEIVNALGETVKNLTVTGLENSMNISDLGNGIYFVKVKNKNSSLQQKLVIEK